MFDYYTEGSGMDFYAVLMRAAACPALVAEYDRLRGTALSKMPWRSGVEVMIDQASGRERDQLEQFVRDMHDVVFERLPAEGS